MSGGFHEPSNQEWAGRPWEEGSGCLVSRRMRDGVRVVQAVEFVSDDPAYAGTMTMTWEVTEVDGGTRVDIIADNVPDGIAADDHAAGLASSLRNLAEYLEG